MIRAYFNNKAAVWDETIAEKDTAKLDRMAERLNIRPGSTLLDVGTGTGVFIPYILKRIGNQRPLVAMDFAEEMLKRARAKFFDGNITYIQADVEDLPLGKDIFDIVVCYSSFPHFQDKPRALSEIKRVLKPGGRVFICHTNGRATINSIHRQIPEVENDTIPAEDEMERLFSDSRFLDIVIGNNPDSYFASARKPIS
jgi:ubiquinone/menaquinone biosynthesis C-methylase UbiE